MACMLRGLWIFHAESDVRLLMSRRFPTVEKKMQRLLGEDYVALPCDEDINVMFITEILHEEEDHYIPPGIPEPFHDDFRQGSFSWNAEQEAHAEKLWPMGPISSICKGKIWPVLFLFKKGFYLVTVVALEKKYKLETVRALELPQITAAFAVLEDVCDFIPANLTISDVAGISELQYYIRSAIPFGSPVNTNYHLLRMVRHGFPAKEDEMTQRSPAWKPYLYKGKSKLTLSIVETVNCTLYGKPEYEDECFIAGNVYCCADIGGTPEICVPISFHNEQGMTPEISVHNCAHVVGGIKAAKEDSFKISCTPPTGPFVLCRYRYARSPVVPIRGFYQIKEMSPVEFRLLLQIQFHPLVGNTFWSCQVRLPFHHRGVIKSHDLKCTGGSFSLTDHGQSILWNLNVRRPRGNLETNLLGELIFESPQPAETQDPGQGMARTTMAPMPGPATSGAGGSAQTSSRSFNEMSSGGADRGSTMRFAGAPQLGAGGTLMVNKGGNAVIIGSALTPSGGLMYASPSAPSIAGRDAADLRQQQQQPQSQQQQQQHLQQQQQQHHQEQVAAAAAAAAAAAPSGEAGCTGAAGANPTRSRTASLLPAETLERRSAEWASSEKCCPAPGGPAGARSPDGSESARTAGTASTTTPPSAGAAAAAAAVAAASTPAASATVDDRGSTAGKEEERQRATAAASVAAAPQPSGGLVQDPFLQGVNCYAEVFLEVPETTLSGLRIDPKAVTVYPTTRVYGGVSVQKEVLTGKYAIWNMAGDVRGHHIGLEFGDGDSAQAAVSSDLAPGVLPMGPSDL